MPTLVPRIDILPQDVRSFGRKAASSHALASPSVAITIACPHDKPMKHPDGHVNHGTAVRCSQLSVKARLLSSTFVKTVARRHGRLEQEVIMQREEGSHAALTGEPLLS
jgi:hypothetical protein